MKQDRDDANLWPKAQDYIEKLFAPEDAAPRAAPRTALSWPAGWPARTGCSGRQRPAAGHQLTWSSSGTSTPLGDLTRSRLNGVQERNRLAAAHRGLDSVMAAPGKGVGGMLVGVKR